MRLRSSLVAFAGALGVLVCLALPYAVAPAPAQAQPSIGGAYSGASGDRCAGRDCSVDSLTVTSSGSGAGNGIRFTGTGANYVCLKSDCAANLTWDTAAVKLAAGNARVTLDPGSSYVQIPNGAAAGALQIGQSSGNNALALTTDGSRVDLGTGSFDYLRSDGSTVWVGAGAGFGGQLGVDTFSVKTAVVSGTGAALILRGSSTLTNDSGSAPVEVDDADGLRIAAKALPTCNAALEGAELRPTGTGGTGTGVRTRRCMCTSDGAASPAFAWLNVVTGTVGTASACNP